MLDISLPFVGFFVFFFFSSFHGVLELVTVLLTDVRRLQVTALFFLLNTFR